MSYEKFKSFLYGNQKAAMDQLEKLTSFKEFKELPVTVLIADTFPKISNIHIVRDIHVTSFCYDRHTHAYCTTEKSSVGALITNRERFCTSCDTNQMDEIACLDALLTFFSNFPTAEKNYENYSKLYTAASFGSRSIKLKDDYNILERALLQFWYNSSLKAISQNILKETKELVLFTIEKEKAFLKTSSLPEYLQDRYAQVRTTELCLANYAADTLENCALDADGKYKKMQVFALQSFIEHNLRTFITNGQNVTQYMLHAAKRTFSSNEESKGQHFFDSASVTKEWLQELSENSYACYKKLKKLSIDTSDMLLVSLSCSKLFTNMNNYVYSTLELTYDYRNLFLSILELYSIDEYFNGSDTKTLYLPRELYVLINGQSDVAFLEVVPAKELNTLELEVISCFWKQFSDSASNALEKAYIAANLLAS